MILQCFFIEFLEDIIMGKDDNRRTFKMKRKKAQTAKKARLKAKIVAATTAVKATPTKTAKK